MSEYSNMKDVEEAVNQVELASKALIKNLHLRNNEIFIRMRNTEHGVSWELNINPKK